MIDRWYPLRPHEQQSQLYRSRSRRVAVAAGRGSGKTEILKRKLVRSLPLKGKPVRHCPKPMYFFHGPTIQQAKRIAWEDFQALIPRNWLAVSRPGRQAIDNTDLIIRTRFNSELHVCGMDKPQRIEGSQWCGGGGDEQSDTRPGTFGRSVRPALSTWEGWYWRIGVPKRYGIGASEFRSCFEADSRWEQYQWPSSDILTREEIEEAKRDLSEEDYSEQYNANWLTAGGLCFYNFDIDVHMARVAYSPHEIIIVGSDFNVSPMCWVLGHLREGRLEFFDEIHLRDTNTQRTLDVLWQRYGARHKGGWRFIGDASSASRHTSASASDYAQIKHDVRFGHKRVEYPRSNPPVRDRVASANALLKNALGDIRVRFDPACRNTIIDTGLRGVDASGQPQNDANIGHASDAWTYVAHQLYPVTRLAPVEGKARIMVEID